MGLDDGDGVPDEGRDPAGQLVEHDSQGVDVHGRRGAHALGHLRGHVEGGADAGGRVSRSGVVADAGDAEVRHPGRGRGRRVVHEDVGGLDVAVNHPGGVHGAQPGRDVGAEGGDPGRRQRALVADDVGEVAAPDVVHYQAEGRALDNYVPDPDDVWAVNALQGVALLEERVDHRALAREIRAKDLEGQGLLGAVRMSFPHLPLRSGADPLVKDVGRAKSLHENPDMIKRERALRSAGRRGVSTPPAFCHKARPSRASLRWTLSARTDDVAAPSRPAGSRLPRPGPRLRRDRHQTETGPISVRN